MFFFSLLILTRSLWCSAPPTSHLSPPLVLLIVLLQEKDTLDGAGNGLAWGCSAMQGWRVEMEVSMGVCDQTVQLHTTNPFGIAPSE